MSATRRSLVIVPLPAAEPVVGRWLGVLEDTRRRTREDLDGLDPRALDWPVEGGNAIGTLLAHIAAIEMDYLYVDILEQDIPAEVLAILPLDVRDEQGNLWVVAGESLAQHWQRLDATRAIFNKKLSALTLDDFYRVRSLPSYDVTPEWVVHHLAQHEAGHRSDINTVRAAFARAHQDEP
jgi:uncharacterized damage-inducible protein DinB